MPSQAINATEADGNVLLEGVDERRIVVTSYLLIADADVTAQFQAGEDNLTGPLPLTEGVALPVSGCELTAGLGEDLVLDLGVEANVAGHLSYMLTR